jgi:sugar lactone lactonase YvrE
MRRFIFLLIPAAMATSTIMVSCAKQNNPPVNAGNAMVTTLAGPDFAGPISIVIPPHSFNQPTGVAVDSAGNVYVADEGNNVIRKISPTGVVTTLAGSGQQGSANGPGASASFNAPVGVAVDSKGNVYVTDYGNDMIRMISQGTYSIGLGFTSVSTLGGNIVYPDGIAVDTLGNPNDLYVSTEYIYQIDNISPSGTVTSLAGTGIGSNNGPSYAASFDGPKGIAVDIAGNVYVADQHNNLIRKISHSGVVTTFAGSGNKGSANGVGTTAVSFNGPTGVAVDAQGNVYVADSGNNLIREISPAGVVTYLAGTGQPGSANGAGFAASFNNPQGVAVDAAGNVYVADTGNNMIRKITQ